MFVAEGAGWTEKLQEYLSGTKFADSMPLAFEPLTCLSPASNAPILDSTTAPEIPLEPALLLPENVEKWMRCLSEQERNRLIPNGFPLIKQPVRTQFQQAVLCAAVRSACEGDPLLDSTTLDRWLDTVAEPLRLAARAVLAIGPDVEVSAEKASAPIWINPETFTLQALARCAPELDFPVDELSSSLGERHDFWEFIQSLPSSAWLIRRLLRLAVDHRAVFGLCTQGELNSILNRRGGLQILREMRCSLNL